MQEKQIDKAIDYLESTRRSQRKGLSSRRDSTPILNNRNTAIIAKDIKVIDTQT